MKRINKTNFFQLFIPNRDILDKNGCIPHLNHEVVAEFKIGSKYFYTLPHDSHVRDVHERLCSNLLNSMPVNNAAVAYRTGISYLNLFEPHRDGYHFLRLDISSFFHSIQERLLRENFCNHFKEEYIDDEETQTLLDGFIALITYKVPEHSANERFKGKVVLPIGFQVSPVISNVIFRKLDILIQKFCASKRIAFSRYADDMLFSSPKSYKYIHSESFLNEIKYLLSIDGFKINKKKTIKTEHTISLNGYIIENKGYISQTANIRISNKKTRIIEKLLYMLDKGDDNYKILTKLFSLRRTSKYFKYLPPKADYLDKYCKDQILNKIAGYRSFLISIIKFNDNYHCVNTEALEKYISLVDSLNRHIK